MKNFARFPARDRVFTSIAPERMEKRMRKYICCGNLWLREFRVMKLPPVSSTEQGESFSSLRKTINYTAHQMKDLL
jgi:hypothetical protein